MAVLLAGCASHQATLKLQHAEDELGMLSKAELRISVDLIDSRGKSKAEVEQREKQFFTELRPTCFAAYEEKLAGALRYAAKDIAANGSLSKLERLPSYVRLLDTFLSKCVEPYGISAYVFMLIDSNSEVRIPEYFNDVVSRAEKYLEAKQRVAREQRESELDFAFFASALAGGLSRASGIYANTDQIFVGPYLRTDGKTIPGHFRTLPNHTCLDNLNGC